MAQESKGYVLDECDGRPAPHFSNAVNSLVSPRASTILGPFLDTYISERTDVKPGTAVFYGHTKRYLVDFFGAEKPLQEITPGDADCWRLSLIGQQLSDNTVRRRCSMAKQFLRAALRQKLIQSNPFEDLKGCVLANRKRDYFLTQEDAQKVLDACPDAQWRLIFALSRYGGLRCPSEHLALRWKDVDWVQNRIYVRSPKTEHHPGGDSRVIPLFPELREYLEDARELAPANTEFVITRYRQANANLRTQLLRIITKAGLTPWPKLFQNLRASRQTELTEKFPAHVVCAWIGSSKAVAEKHYLQVTDAHYLEASERSSAAYILQQSAAETCNDPQSETAPESPTDTGQEQPVVLQGLAHSCGNLQSEEENLQLAGVGDEGLEPPTSTL